MKKTIAWILALALIAVATVIGTVAYLKDVDSAENIMTIGEVHIALREYERKDTETTDDAAVVQPFNNNKPLLPAVIDKDFDYTAGDTYVDWDSADNQIKPGTDYTSPIWDPSMINNEVDKMVFVENTGDYSAYVRIYFAFEAGNFDTFDEFQKMIHVNLNDDADEWVWEWVPFLATNNEGGKYFIAKATYQKVLEPGKLTEISLSQIALDSLADNEDVAAFGDTYEVFVNAQGIQSAGFDDPETALDEGFGDDIPFTNLTPITGVDLKTALHNLNGDDSNPITANVATVTFGLNEGYPNVVANYEGTLTSVEQDAMVYTYYVPNATNAANYDIYVLADDTIYTPKSSTELFRDMAALTAVDTTNMDVSRTENMSKMFANCENLKTLNVAEWNVGNVNNMRNMFYKCYALETLDVSSWNVSNVNDMGLMFYQCKALDALEVSEWNTEKVTNMGSVFRECYKLDTPDVSNWKTGNVTDMHNMFLQCFEIDALDLSGWDVSKVTTMDFMFQRCTSLTSLDVSSWNVGSVTTMSNMFAGCTALETLDVSGWDVSKVVNFKQFFSCYDPAEPMNIKYLDVSNWDTGSATDMTQMFNNCKVLNGLDVSKWDVSNVTTLYSTFEKCRALERLNVSNWDVSNVKDMNGLFSNCEKLTELDLNGWNTATVNKTQYMFNGCSKLETIYVGDDWDMTGVTASAAMFSGCPALVGGEGTTIAQIAAIEGIEAENVTNKTYAIVDGGTEAPGYLTYKPAAESTNP